MLLGKTGSWRYNRDPNGVIPRAREGLRRPCSNCLHKRLAFDLRLPWFLDKEITSDAYRRELESFAVPSSCMSKGLTPGKLRGLQRISNPNGTLTMVALDQNSSMIEMAAKALKAKGHDREPTYEEIVEAKVDLARHLAPFGFGRADRCLLRSLVVRGRGRNRPSDGPAGAGRDVGQPQEQGRGAAWA